MDLDRALIVIGGNPVTLLDAITAAAIFALLLLIAAVVLSWRAQANRQAGLRRTVELEYRIAELSGALKSLVEQSQRELQYRRWLATPFAQTRRRTQPTFRNYHRRIVR